MRKSLGLLSFFVTALVPLARAYEYPLQSTPNAGYRGLVVAGYYFSGNNVVGNCSYYTVHSGSGKGGGYHTVTTYYNQTCIWDSYGNLLSVTGGAPVVPSPLYVKGTQTVYAANATGDFTGTDTKPGYSGFVNTPGSHYSWITSNTYAVLQQTPFTFIATLASDGDLPLAISAVEVSALHAATSIQSTTCIGEIPAGSTCGVTLLYDPTKLRSPTGLAYDTLNIGVTADSGQSPAFIQNYTIVLSRKSDGEDDN
jgi:hypothetical protein